VLKITPDAQIVADQIRDVMPVQGEAFEGTLLTYCILLVRIQRAHDALVKREAELEEWDAQEHEPDEKRPSDLAYLSTELQKWTSSSLKFAAQLGLTPAAASAIRRDLAGGHPGDWRPPNRDDLRPSTLESLRKVSQALQEALKQEDFIDAT